MEKVKGIKMHINFFKSISKTCEINKSKLQKDIKNTITIVNRKTFTHKNALSFNGDIYM